MVRISLILAIVLVLQCTYLAHAEDPDSGNIMFRMHGEQRIAEENIKPKNSLLLRGHSPTQHGRDPCKAEG